MSTGLIAFRRVRILQINFTAMPVAARFSFKSVEVCDCSANLDAAAPRCDIRFLQEEEEEEEEGTEKAVNEENSERDRAAPTA